MATHRARTAVLFIRRKHTALLPSVLPYAQKIDICQPLRNACTARALGQVFRISGWSGVQLRPAKLRSLPCTLQVRGGDMLTRPVG